MLHVLKSEVFIRGGGGSRELGGTRPPLSEFFGFGPEEGVGVAWASEGRMRKISSVLIRTLFT